MNDFNNFSVDVVIPVRSRDEYDVCERLLFRIGYNLPNCFKFLVVDYGSESSESLRIKEVCDDNGFVYLYVNAVNKIWNASKARNLALLYSSADYVVFEDVDLLSDVMFYHKIKLQIINLLIKKRWPFFSVPVAYLTEITSSKLDSPMEELQYDEFVTDIFDVNNSEHVEFFAPTSSLLVCNRLSALFVGGYDESFEGWGFEDSDFWVKLLRDTNIEKPREFYKLDTRPYSNQVEWRGWRALFRIFADVCAQKGIYSFHKWHPIAEHRSDFIRAKNHKIFLKNCEYYSRNAYSLIPLWNPKKKTSLFLSLNPHSFNKELFEFFSNPLLIEEKDLSISEIEYTIKKFNIEVVVFNNPFGNAKRLAIYEVFKEKNIKCFVVERGALPWSIYVDAGGFCAESKSYKDFIHHELTEERLKKTLNYINELKTTGVTLEPQSNMVGGVNLRREVFGFTKGFKILFVALQSPSDTTTNYFCGQIQSYDNFINEMMKLPLLLEGSEWKVVYKNHPLSIEHVNISGAFNVNKYHIGDILEACDSVALINSGVGVLAAAYQKTVYCFGQAFYQNSPLSYSVSHAKMLVEYLHLNKDYDEELSYKFISFLINDFYSFATWTREERSHTKEAKLSISKNIKFNTLRVWNQGKVFEKEILNSNFISLKESHLFDRYRLEEYMFRTKKPNEKDVKSIVKTEQKIEKIIKNSPLKKTAENNQLIDFGGARSKIEKLIKDPNKFFLDYFSKRIK